MSLLYFGNSACQIERWSSLPLAGRVREGGDKLSEYIANSYIKLQTSLPHPYPLPRGEGNPTALFDKGGTQ